MSLLIWNFNISALIHTRLVLAELFSSEWFVSQRLTHILLFWTLPKLTWHNFYIFHSLHIGLLGVLHASGFEPLILCSRVVPQYHCSNYSAYKTTEQDKWCSDPKLQGGKQEGWEIPRAGEQNREVVESQGFRGASEQWSTWSCDPQLEEWLQLISGITSEISVQKSPVLGQAKIICNHQAKTFEISQLPEQLKNTTKRDWPRKCWTLSTPEALETAKRCLTALPVLRGRLKNHPKCPLAGK